MNGSTTDVDRLSDLPDVILHHIFSFLNMKQVGETSVLSKRWRYLWGSLPFLNFDKELVESLNSTEEESTALKDFVQQVLLERQNTDIQKFHLYCPKVNSLCVWTVYLRHRNIQEISIVMGYTCLSNRELPVLSHLLFTSTSLKVLELYINNAPLKYILPCQKINLPVLQTLLLHGFSLDDTFDKLFYACPILESLTIQNCSIHFSHLKISSLKLRQLVIDNDCGDDDHHRCLPSCCAIKVCAPNLLSLCCKDNMLIDYSLKNLSSLVKADIYLGREGGGGGGGLSAKEEERANETSAAAAEKEKRYTKSTMEVLRAVQKVTTLTLSAPDSIFQAFSESDALEGTQFCNLRCLKVCAKNSKNSKWIKGVTCLLKISPNIESVSLTGEMSDLTYEEARLSLGTFKHLKFVEFKNPYGERC